MKYLTKILSLLAITLVCYGCADFSLSCEDFYVCKDEENNYTISIENAIDYLNAYMCNESNCTRGRKIDIKDISVIKYANQSTRADVNCDTLLYIVNFEENRGYAVLSADSRIPERIIAVVDSGNASLDIENNRVIDLKSARPTFSDYPLTGEGIYKLPETGDNLYFNPNTINLYDSIYNESLVGNFTSKMDSLSNSYRYFRRFEPQQVQLSLCVNYANNMVENGDNNGNLGNTQTHYYDVYGNIIDANDHNSQRYDYVTQISYITDSEVSPMLAPFKNWNQRAPYNSLYPIVHCVIDFETGKLFQSKQAVAGCFPLAMAKLQTYFKCLVGKSHYGFTIDYDILYHDYDTDYRNQNAAHLLRKISDECDSYYFYEGTFTFPGKVRDYMRDLFFKDVRSASFSFGTAKEMLDQGKPLMVYVVPNYINLIRSHAWNIDGYKILKKISHTQILSNGKVVNTYIQEEKSPLVHCDFGWSGSCNGYYIPGIFVISSNTQLDNSNPPKKENQCNYDYRSDYIQQILYNTDMNFHLVRPK